MRKAYLVGSIMVICFSFFFVSAGIVQAATAPAQAVTPVQAETPKEEKKEAVAVDAWDLGVGSRGDSVVQLQRVLALGGCYAGAIDGIFGRQTEAAVQKAQLSMGVDVTGRSSREFVEGLRRMNESSPSRGASFRATRVLTMEATAYTPYDAGVSGITANGNRMRRGLVAVDTRVIPFGTRLYIEGYGFAVADDTGGAIRGNKIDLAMDTLSEAYQFGRRTVVVHILE